MRHSGQVSYRDVKTALSGDAAYSRIASILSSEEREGIFRDHIQDVFLSCTFIALSLDALYRSVKSAAQLSTP